MDRLQSGSATFSNDEFEDKLKQFRELIEEMTLQNDEGTPDERRQKMTETLRYEDFCDAIRRLFGSDLHNDDLKMIYRKISTNPDAPVDWSEIFGLLHPEQEEAVMDTKETIDNISIFMIQAKKRIGDAAGNRKRRDVIQNVRYMPNQDCYLTCSQQGAIAVWSAAKLRLIACTDIKEKAWVTGCDYLPALRRVVTCTERCLAIWDIRAKSNQQLFTIKPIENSPQCCCYLPPSASPFQNDNPQETNYDDLLLIGDDQGCITVLALSSSDLSVKNPGKERRYSNSESYVIDPNKLTTPMRKRRLHNDWVVGIKYFPELRSFASCSQSSTQSFVLEPVERLIDDGPVRAVSIPKGVNAFTFCSKSNIIATGGIDKIIRVWHPNIFSRPTGKLTGHLFTIVDITCNEKDQHVISLSTARIFRIWDIHTLTSLQVFTDTEERPGEKRIYSIFFDNKYDRLITGSSVLDSWPLTRSVQDTMQVPQSHDRPITSLLVNEELQQVISICTEPTAKIWESEAGKMVYQMQNLHGKGVEVTASAIDTTGYRLATGAVDGSIKLWDLGSGQPTKMSPGYSKVEDDEFSIVAMTFFLFQSVRHLAAAGRKNLLLIFTDGNDGNDLTKIANIQNDLLKSHQIQSLFVYLYEDLTYLICGCQNGAILLWNLENYQLCNVLTPKSTPATPLNSSINLRNKSSNRRTLNRRQSMSNRSVLDIKVLVYRRKHIDPEYLKRKADKNKLKDSQEIVQNTPPIITSPVNVRRSISKSRTHSIIKSVPLANVDETIVEDEEMGEIKSEEEENKESQEDEDEKHMIEQTFPPIIVTCHKDGYVRMWNFKGEQLLEMATIVMTNDNETTSVMSLCANADCSQLFLGDNKGYINIWDVSNFLMNPQIGKEGIDQIICWRAHLTRITSMSFINSSSLILSSSVDGSVRIWWGIRGRFVGFFGQQRPLLVPLNDRAAITLPYDITELPFVPSQSNEKQTSLEHSMEIKIQYPLIFSNKKWKTFRRSAHIAQREIQVPDDLDNLSDKKYFNALIKPKLETVEKLPTTESKQLGVIGSYHSLGVYTLIDEPEKDRYIPNYIKRSNEKDGKSKQKQISTKERVHMKRQQRQKYSILPPIHSSMESPISSKLH